MIKVSLLHRTSMEVIVGVGVNVNINNNNYEEIQLDSVEISYHFVNIIPTNHNFLDRNTHLGGKLCNLNLM